MQVGPCRDPPVVGLRGSGGRDYYNPSSNRPSHFCEHAFLRPQSLEVSWKQEVKFPWFPVFLEDNPGLYSHQEA